MKTDLEEADPNWLIPHDWSSLGQGIEVKDYFRPGLGHPQAQHSYRDISKWDVPNISDLFGMLNNSTATFPSAQHSEVGRVKHIRLAWHAQHINTIQL